MHKTYFLTAEQVAANPALLDEFPYHLCDMEGPMAGVPYLWTQDFGWESVAASYVHGTSQNTVRAYQEKLKESLMPNKKINESTWNRSLLAMAAFSMYAEPCYKFERADHDGKTQFGRIGSRIGSGKQQRTNARSVAAARKNAEKQRKKKARKARR